LNRTEFLDRLEKLLSDVEKEEREEALAYYTDYFEDAGKEKEADVIMELGSPEKVAESIKADLAHNGAGGEFTEKGFEPEYKDKYQISRRNEVGNHNPDEYVDVEFREAKDDNPKNDNMKDAQKADEEALRAAGADQNWNDRIKNQTGSHSYSQEEDLGYRIGPDGRKYYENTGRYQSHTTRREERRQEQPIYQKRSAGEIILLTLFVLFIGIPVGIPCLAVVFSLFVAAGATVFSLVVGFGAAGIGCLVAGLAVLVVGISKLFVFPGVGAMFLGGGLICFGIGLLFILLTGLCAKALPALCRGFVAVCRAPFRHRSVMA